MADKVAGQRPRRGTGGATSTDPGAERAWLLSWGRPSRNAAGSGMVGALIVGALALVVALIALTIAIGRTPTDAAADQRPTASNSAPAGPSTFESPEQTGKRWSPVPIITGVPQHQPSYEPTPTPTPTPSEESSQPSEPAEQPAVSAGQPGNTEAPPPGQASVVGRNPNAPEHPGRP